MPASITDRLASAANRSTLRLTHRGRKSGKAYEVTIWFVVDGDAMYLTTMNRGRQWVRNVVHTPLVALQIGPEGFTGAVEPVTGEHEQRRVYDLLVGKYWVMWLIDWGLAIVGRNPRHGTMDPGRGGFFRVRVGD